MPSQDTTFVARSTTIATAWLQALNNALFRGSNPVYVNSTGSANAYTVTLPATSLCGALAVGNEFTWRANFTNTGAATLRIAGSSNTDGALVTPAGAALSAGQIVSGAVIKVVYTDASTFQVLNPNPLTSSTLTDATLAGTTSFTGLAKQAKGADIASAGTVNLALATGNEVHITGSTGPITSLGSVTAGAQMLLIFDSTPSITYNATSLKLSTGGASYVCKAGDRMIAVSEGSGNWTCTILGFEGPSGMASVAEIQAATISNKALGPANTAAALLLTQGFNLRFSAPFFTVSTAGSGTIAHGLPRAPSLAMVALFCLATDAGYTAGQTVLVSLNNYDPGGGTGIAVAVDATNIYYKMANIPNVFAVLNLSTGSAVFLTNAKWQVSIQVWA